MSVLFYSISFVTHTKISMGYLVAPDKSAFGGIRSLTRASNPPGTGTLKRRTTGCDFSAIISETASFASHVSIFVEFWKGRMEHGDATGASCLCFQVKLESNLISNIRNKIFGKKGIVTNIFFFWKLITVSISGSVLLQMSDYSIFPSNLSEIFSLVIVRYLSKHWMGGNLFSEKNSGV